jgi:hypothetical protein
MGTAVSQIIRAFGLTVTFELDVPELEPVSLPSEPSQPSLRVCERSAADLERAWSGALSPPAIGHAMIDGSLWTVERGLDGDLRMRHPLAKFHLDAAATVLRCAPARSANAAWRRLLLDTALATASLARYDALHAACVVRPGAAVAIAGEAGSGKTSLTLELIRRGAHFLADDIVTLESADGGVLAHPGPPMVNLDAATAADDLTVRLHRIGGEWWARIRQPAARPAPIGCVIVLRRSGGPGPPMLEEIREPAALLLSHVLHSGTLPARLERRLTVVAHLARTARVLAVHVTDSAPPPLLADLLVRELPELRAVG